MYERGFKFGTPEEKKAARESAYRGTTEMAHESSLSEYLEVLELPLEALKGKRVLDIGSSIAERMAREARDEGIEVIPMNPELADYWVRRGRKREDAPRVAAIVQEMPFADESFDFEVSMYGVPGYLPEYSSEYMKTFLEVCRTLKVGGEARFFPISEELYKDSYFDTIIDQLKKNVDSIYNGQTAVEVWFLPRKISGKTFYTMVIKKKKVIK